MKAITGVIIIFVCSLMLARSAFCQGKIATPQQTLNMYISDLKGNPNDNVLREKIIRHVQTMKPKPVIPEEARRYFVEGNALLKAAKAQKGYGLAIDAYRQCLLIAPWWAEALYNYAVALDLANQSDEGMNALKLYIATNPGDEESRKAQDKIYEIGAKKKLAAQEREESSPQAVAAREQNKFDDWLKKLDGRRYTADSGMAGHPGWASLLIIDIKGEVLVEGSFDNDGRYNADRRPPIKIQGRETTANWNPPGVEKETFTISEDGERITFRYWFIGGGKYLERIYLWQR